MEYKDTIELNVEEERILRVVAQFEQEEVDFSNEKRFWSLSCRPNETLSDERRDIKRYVHRKLLKYRDGKLGNLSIIAQRSKVPLLTIRDMINAIPTPYSIWLKVGKAIDDIERETTRTQKGTGIKSAV